MKPSPFARLISACMVAAALIATPVLTHGGAAAAQSWDPARREYMREMMHPNSDYNRGRRAEEARRSAPSTGSGSGPSFGEVVILGIIAAAICASNDRCRNAVAPGSR